MGNTLIFIGAWGVLSLVVFQIKVGFKSEKSEKIVIMSCRNELKKYKRIKDSDNKSIF